MAAICINDLQAGFDLISDHETYLNELTDEEFRLTKGGTGLSCIASGVVASLLFSVLTYGAYTAIRHYRR